LSTGQINDAFFSALGRYPTGDEIRRYSSRGDLEGNKGQSIIIGELSGGRKPTTTEAKVPTAEDILREQKAKLTEQVTFLRDFLSANPLGFDEVMARTTAEEKYKPYYQEVLSDFVNPIREKISYSSAEQNRVLDELTRSTALGQKRIKRDTQEAISRAREGFAGAGLLGSGLERGVTSRAEVAGRENLQDFMAKSDYSRAGTIASGELERSQMNRSIANKERDLFGAGREFSTAVTKEVESQRQAQLKKRSLRALEAVGSRFGSPLSDIPNYLELYNV
jgi:hypothetical protein